MMLRTPPPKRPRTIDAAPIIETPPTAGSDRHKLVVYEDPASHNQGSPHQHSEQMLCTYQCRQMVKADFIDALSKAEKQVQDYQSQLAALNDNFLKADDERKNFREKLSYAEQELAAAKGREKSFHDQLMKEVNDSHDRLKKQLELSNKLEAKLENEQNLRRIAESAATAAKDKASELEAKLGHISESIEREKNRLNNELVQLKRDTKFSTSKIAGDLEKMEFRARSAEEEVELLREQLEELQSKFSECLYQKSELEVQISSLSYEAVSPKESDILVKNLREELRSYESEVKEARKLKSAHENYEVMNEKLLKEKSRRERAELQLLKLQEYEVKMTTLEDDLSAWKRMIQNIPDVSCCDDVPLKIAALQNSNSSLLTFHVNIREVVDNMKKLGDATAQLKQLEVILDATQLDKQKTETEAALAKEEAGRLEAEVKRISLELSAVSEERNRLKSVIEDFKSNKEKGGESTTSGVMQELELSLSKKESYIEELKRDLDAQKGINYHQRDEIKSLHDRLNNEARRVKSLERESDRLRSEISLLESKLGHGDFSAANTKVLRMVNTLAVDNDAKQTIEALQSELQKTKEKLQALEELKSQPGDAGKLVDSYISGKVTQLKEQIATLEKREERYKTVFADRISVFRRACCELFGYKIVMDERQRPNGIPVTRFTLQSIYAQSEDEKLEFEYESGNTNIVANEYTSASEISRQVEIFIRKMNSIPAFTANLTVESFNRRTLS
ncbi:Mitotic spindle checkpoint protein MAD1 [Linum grandiflorum]